MVFVKYSYKKPPFSSLLPKLSILTSKPFYGDAQIFNYLISNENPHVIKEDISQNHPKTTLKMVKGVTDIIKDHGTKN